MDHYREHQKSSKNHPKEDKGGSNYSEASEAEIIEKYTNLLLQGNKSEALGKIPDACVNHFMLDIITLSTRHLCK